MRGQAISLLVGLGAVAAAACGGGGGPVTGGSVPLNGGGYDDPNATYETPSEPSALPDNSSPGTAQDHAPTDYQPTGGEDSATGGLANQNAALCAELCQVLVAGNCLEEISQGNGTDPILETQASCDSRCRQEIGAAVVQQPCLAQVVELFACLYGDAAPSCDLINAVRSNNASDQQEQDLAEQARASCGDQLAALTKCSPPSDMPNMNDGCMLPRCNRCATDCDRCDCDGNQAACTACIAS
jgi:hypothetical protein